MTQSTTDYRQFKLMPGNRRVVKAHVTNLAKSIALHPEILEIRPILVNKNMEVIDGQHRLAACKMLKVPVWYEKAGDLSADEAVIINNNQRNWSVLDYARSFAAYGKQDYKDFLRVHDKHPNLPIYTVLRYIGGPNKNLTGAGGVFKTGGFKAATLEIGEVYLEMLVELAEMYPRFGLTAPSLAMFKIFQLERYDQDRMIRKLNIVSPTMVRLHGSSEEILRNLEDIYNFKQQSDTLRFY